MFENLTGRLSEAARSLSGKGRITDSNIKDTLRQVRLALLEADVALPVVKSFIDGIREKAIGENVAKSLTPGQALVKIIHGELVRILGESFEPLDLKAQPPVVVLMAGPTVAGERIIRGQAEAILLASGGGEAQVAALRDQQDRLFQAVRSGEGWEELEARAREQVRAQLAAMPEAQRQALGDPEAYADGVISGQLAAARSDWYRFFIDYDPAPALARLDVPVLAAFGEKDLQVLLDDNRPAFESIMAAAGNDRATARTFEGANHLFQAAVTGTPAEYATLEKAFVPGFLEDVAEWIQSVVR